MISRSIESEGRVRQDRREDYFGLEFKVHGMCSNFK